jgi:Cu(I)/Ag(I) efflux system membrane fusion protein
MSHMHLVLGCVLLAAATVISAGCAKEPAPPETPAVPEPPAMTGPPTDTGDQAATEMTGSSDSAEVEAAFASLSDADRTAALAQKICPVSDHELGGMGTPVKVSVAGRDVFICCESCRESLLADPDKHLAKLPPTP